MVYHKLTLGPTEGQMDDLSHGTEVKLSNEHFTGEIPFELTTAQVKKLQKAAAAGRGATLKLSAAQIKHHALNGSGRFADILRGGYNLLKPVLKMGLSKGMDFGRDYAEKKISNLAGLDQQGGSFLSSMFGGSAKKPRKQRGKGFIGDIARWGGHKAVDGLVGLCGGEIDPAAHAYQDPFRGMPTTGPTRQMAGKGFIGNIARKVGHTLVDGGVTLLGGSLQPNQLANPNEGLRAALFQKKVSGRGLYL